MIFSLVVLPSGCESITNASEYEVLQPASFEGLCNACPGIGPEIRRPPCPRPSSVPDRNEMFAYVYRFYQLGFDSTEWTGPNKDAFDLGYDHDCSTRLPTGRPVHCEPCSVGSNQGTPWVPLPHGIDNALSQRVLGPLFDFAKIAGQDGQLDRAMNERVAEGKSSVMIVVERWNGTPNDPKVTARIVSAAGISEANGGPPRWDGNDKWDALSDGRDPNSPFGAPNTVFVSDDAYVSDGTLVLDLGFLGVADITVAHNSIRLKIPLHGMAVIGDISETELRNISVIGRWAQSDGLRATDDIADFLSGCEPTKRDILKKYLEPLLKLAPDLPLDDEATPGVPCSAVSVGYGAEAVRARVGGYRPASSLPEGCQ